MIGLNYLGKMGQLGNQMFQYAALKGIARNRGLDFIIPNHGDAIVDSLGNTLRIELFEPFNIESKYYGFIETNEYIQEAIFTLMRTYIIIVLTIVLCMDFFNHQNIF